MRSAAPVATAVPTMAYASVSGADAHFTTAAEAGTVGFGAAGDRLVYQGTGTAVTVTGLAAHGTYHIGVFTGSGAVWSAAVVRSETALPVELVTFTAYASGSHVVLAWKTACEINNAGFSIEKKAANSEWTSIAFVDGHGTVNAPQTYSYADACKAGKYVYRLKQIDRDGAFSYSHNAEVTVALTADEYSLGQNHPNPFNPATIIHFAVKREQHAKLVVFTPLGQEVATLFDGIARKHTLYAIEFNGAGCSSGIYFYTLQTDDLRETKKMSLVK